VCGCVVCGCVGWWGVVVGVGVVGWEPVGSAKNCLWLKGVTLKGADQLPRVRTSAADNFGQEVFIQLWNRS
jgi:hypothetical protein